jgi:site-specific recombinase XerD
LRHLQASGRNKEQLKKIAKMLLHIIHVLQLTELRYIDNAEIKEAALRWASEDGCQRKVRGTERAADRFMYAAQKWLRFQNILVMPKKPEYWFDPQLAEFRHAMSLTGLAQETCNRYLLRTRLFLRRVASRKTSVRTITISDIDEYIDDRLNASLSHQTIEGDYQALRVFFRYAETRSWCERGFARVLQSPVRRKHCSESKGPTWREARRLISSCDRVTPSDLRAKAILILCSVYGLRSGEVTRLCLKDFDWQNEIMTVRRCKSGRVQQFPIQYEAGEAIIEYLRGGRPQSSCRNLFMAQFPPYRPLRVLWPIVSRRMKQLKISSQNLGPHALRHACATELLKRGASLREIADFLGHRNLRSVGIYAKHDLRSLREVAKMSLAGVL